MHFYIQTILKIFKRSRFNLLVNLSGLVIGISSAILIFIYVQDELSYDKYHENVDRIYRITSNDKPNDGENHYIALANYFLTQIFLEEYPEVDNAVRMSWLEGSPTVKYQAKKYVETKFYFTDPSIFEIFTYPLVSGDSETVLEDPGSIVLSESTASRYFGDEDPIGKSLKINDEELYVSGVMKDLPSQSDMPIDALIHMPDDWNDLSWVYTFVLFNDSFDENEFRSKLDRTIHTDLQPFYDEDDITIDLQFQALGDLHFAEGWLFDTPKSNKRNLYFFSLVGVLMLCMAAINYVNLTLAEGNLRGKEVAIRKVAGADKSQILFQLFGEHVFVTSLAFLISLIICILIFPYFSQLTSKQLVWQKLLSSGPIAILFLVFMGINFLCAIYPAWLFSSFSPAQVLKGKWVGGEKLQIQKMMLALQFVISAGMIICTLSILKQVDYIQNRDAGLVMDRVIKIQLPLNEEARKKAIPFKNAILNQTGVLQASLVGANAIPGGEIDLDIFTVEGIAEYKKKVMSYLDVDDQYFDILDLQLLHGRHFTPNSEADKLTTYIVNEAYARLMGWDNIEEDILDRTITIPDYQGQDIEGNIIGVVKDFNFRSVHHKIEPLIIIYSEEYPGYVLLKVASKNVSTLIGQVRETWFSHFPEFVFEFAFLDEYYNRQYEKENTMYKLFVAFTLLAILITVLGLFSISLITVRRRIKSIGVRKVLGANTLHLLIEFNKEFLVIIGFALLVTIPLSWWLMNSWLEGFAYRISLSYDIFIVAAVGSALLTLITTSYHILKTGNVNLVETLKHE